MTITKPILVLGGTGKTGRRILDRLQRLGLPTRCGSRASQPAFDWEAPETWPAVLEGCGAIYIAYQPDLAVPGAVEAVQELLGRCVEAGLKKFVLLSGRGEEEAQRAERVLQATDLDWTILRASWFNQNFSENFLLDAIQSGVLALPVGAVQEPFVDVEDIAEIAVAALTEERHSRKLYELTGPKLMSFADAAAAISVASGRPIQFVEITTEQYAAGLAEHGLPKAVSELVLYLFTTVLDGRNSKLASGVLEALGREPRSFNDYVAETVTSGVWGGEQ